MVSLPSWVSIAEVDFTEGDKESRYYTDHFLNDGVNTYLPGFQKTEIEIKDEYLYHTVSAGEENRLDLIAYKYYKNSALWWVIARVNVIKNPLNVAAGTVLRIPQTEYVYGEIID